MLGRRLDFGHVAGREQGAALQEGEVGLQVRRALTGHALLRLRVERKLERLRDLHGDLVLDRKDVTWPPVEAHRPHFRSGLRVDQLRRHPHARRLALHAAFEQVTRAELAADLAGIFGPVAKRERRSARYHVELGEARSWCSTDSAMPEASTSASRDGLRFWNGSTAIARPRAPDGPRSDCRTSSTATAARSTAMIATSA